MIGVKHDAGKPRWDLMPWLELEQVNEVLNRGAVKYSPWNWLVVPEPRKRYLSAAFRHLVARAKGELLDRETGLSHTAHAICCLLFLMHFDAGETEGTQDEH